MARTSGPAPAGLRLVDIGGCGTGSRDHWGETQVGTRCIFEAAGMTALRALLHRVVMRIDRTG